MLCFYVLRYVYTGRSSVQLSEQPVAATVAPCIHCISLTITDMRQLKGHPVKKLKQEVNRMIRVLRLEEKRHVYSRSLSGGMKRKLSVGIALIAGSKVRNWLTKILSVTLCV